ncbi:MAG: YdcF family protein [Lachnospiraceae bacterium]
MGLVLLGLGILCCVYYVICIVYASPKASYVYVWLVAGILLTLGGGVYLCGTGRLRQLILVVCIVALPVLLLLLGVGSRIVSAYTRDESQKADCILVLGAKVYGMQMSRTLKERADQALAYLRQHADTSAVLCGGQGDGEDITEALCLYNYLAAHGVEKSRLIQESTSVSTKENIGKGYAVLPSDVVWVGIVTSDFHMFRSLGIARKTGTYQVLGIPAVSHSPLQMHYLLREVVAVIKDKVKGNM